MKRFIRIAAGALALFGSTQVALAQAEPESHASPAPSAPVVRLTGPVEIDGILREEVWETASPATDFTQQDPQQGDPATQRTEVRFAMDEEALYVGARMYDTMGNAGVRTQLARRDQDLGGDWLELAFDTFHDHSGITVFRINPSAVKFDAGQAAPNADPSWDPVWQAATQVDSLGWTAELRIPLSQLRFSGEAEQTWGVNIWRIVERIAEVSMWSYWAKDEAGGPQRFGHLTDVRVPERVRGFEVLPYSTVRASYLTPTQPGSPFQRPSEYNVLVGGDVKAVLSSTLTLNATVNPDFGQVEVDPAVVNLSAFETFLQEKRPFFVEGSGLFGFGGFSCFFCSNTSSNSLFYSRRIGRRPQGSVPSDVRFAETPETTRILGAAKITGRTRNGLQMGLLDAVTSREQAMVVGMDGERSQPELEPLTNYLVGRLRQTYRDGDVRVGAIATSVLRKLDSESLSLQVPERASALGFDWNAAFVEQTYRLEGNLAFTEVTGEPEAMLRLQNSSARYFARPDRVAGSNRLFTTRYDPGLRSLRGFAGYSRFAKNAGKWQWEAAVNFRSPGFEVNDLGFQNTADFVWMNGNVMHLWTEPTRFFREANILAGGQQQYNFEGDRTGREGRISFWMEALNYWQIGAFVIRRTENLDDRLTRGGPVVGRPSGSYAQLNVRTDGRKSLILETNPSYWWGGDGGYEYAVNLWAQVKPTSGVVFSFGPRYTGSRNPTQYVAGFSDPTATHFLGQRVVFADLEQHGLSMDTRLGITFTPDLTFELFAQPLLASGAYSRFKEFAAPRTLRAIDFTPDQVTPSTAADGSPAYSLDPDLDPQTAPFTFRNPDFNLRSLRGNAVLRWEYRPGSTIFVVWQQNRSGREPFGDMEMTRDLRGMLGAESDDILMVKATFWVGR